MSDISKQGPEESYIISNVLRLRVPYFPLSNLDKNGVIESNRQIIQNESKKAANVDSDKTDWELGILFAGIVIAAIAWLCQVISSQMPGRP